MIIYYYLKLDYFNIVQSSSLFTSSYCIIYYELLLRILQENVKEGLLYP